MRAKDVMTANVLTVSPTTSVHDLAVMLCEHNISGVPVVDAGGNLVGIVSEADLIRRTEVGTDRSNAQYRLAWFERITTARADAARAYVRAHAQVVGDIMTRSVVMVDEETSLDVVADLLDTRHIKRVPVMRDRLVVGIVSRANLVRALAEAPPPAAADADDATLRRHLLTELDGKPWSRIWATDVVVKDKVVHIWYSDDHTDEERRALRVAAETTPGVHGVQEHIVRVPMTPLL